MRKHAWVSASLLPLNKYFDIRRSALRRNSKIHALHSPFHLFLSFSFAASPILKAKAFRIPPASIYIFSNRPPFPALNILPTSAGLLTAPWPIIPATTASPTGVTYLLPQRLPQFCRAVLHGPFFYLCHGALFRFKVTLWLLFHPIQSRTSVSMFQSSCYI